MLTAGGDFDPGDRRAYDSGMSDASEPDLSAVSLFPLPNIVLFPRAVLPLHVFEERYKQMTADALAGDQLIAMALLKSGWETNYYARAAIEPIVCVGRILSHERLADGKYNFLLQGAMRARIIHELSDEDLPYRVAQLQALEEVPAMEIDLEEARRRMVELFTRGVLGATGAGEQFTKILRTHLPTRDVADLVAFTFIDDLSLKQSLLAEPDVRARVTRVVDALAEMARAMSPSVYARFTGNSSVN
jgi:Lon protease-like protein